MKFWDGLPSFLKSIMPPRNQPFPFVVKSKVREGVSPSVTDAAKVKGFPMEAGWTGHYDPRGIHEVRKHAFN